MCPELAALPRVAHGDAKAAALLFVFATLLGSNLSRAQPTTADAGAPPAHGGSDDTPLAGGAIVPPRLIHFEEARYPEDAAQQGLEAAVVLQISIDAEGRVTTVEVREPVGHGFDDAAARAAARFIFEPATRGGAPVAARILYRYQFRLEEKLAPPAPQDAAAESAVGELRGRLVAGSPPAPLAGVPLRISPRVGQPLDAPAQSVVTSADGTWAIGNLAPGEYVVEVEATGYRRVSQLETVVPGQTTAITYGLEVSDELPLEIKVRGPALRREVTHYELPRTELLRVPGTMGDAILAAEALPSVARPRGLAGTLIIRGSAPEDSLVHIEGTPVPYVFHYGGLASVVPSEMLERLEFYPSNFSVRYGRAMGGIVEVRMRETNPDGRYHGSAQVDLINTRANVEGPLPGMVGWSFMAGARASYFDRWLAPIVSDGSDPEDGLPRYYDYQLYLERRLPGNGVYRLGFFGAHDVFVPIQKGQKDWLVPRGNSFGHLQSLLRLPLSSEVDLRASWSLGRNKSRVAEDDRSMRTTYTLGTLRSELSVKTGRVGIARLGGDILYAPFKVEAFTDRRSTGGEVSSLYIDSPDLEEYDLRGVYLRPAAYAEYELAPTRRIDVTLGTRLDYTEDTRDIDIAPRLAARYVLVDQPRTTVLKGGVGLFYQPPLASQTLPELGTAGLESSRAIHTMLGVEQSLMKHVSLSVEGFEKELRDLVVEREDGSGNQVTENSGRGRIWGTDLLLRYHSDERFFGWLAYTLSRSTRVPVPGDPEELDRYDQTHILNLLASYRLGRGWEIGGRFRYATGVVYKSCYGGLFDNATGEYRCYGELNQKRLGPYHQLDLRAEKTWELSAYRLSAYIDVINAYYHYSPDKPVENFDFSDMKPLSRSLPLLPSIGVRGEI